MTTRHEIHLFDGAQQQLGMLPLFAAATSFVFATAVPNAAYARSGWIGYQPLVGIAALFAQAVQQMPAAPLLKPDAAYVRTVTSVTAPQTFTIIAQPDQITPGSSKLDAAYVRPRDTRTEWDVLGPWAGAFYPVDPIYNFTGPTLQSVAAHYRPRDTRTEWEVLGPWAGAFYPVDPVYVYNPVVTSLAAYARPVTLQQPQQFAVQQPVAAYIPIGSAKIDAAYLRPRDARTEWEPLGPWAGAFYPADPVYIYGGATLQPIAAHNRPRDARTEWEVIGPWYAAFDVAQAYNPTGPQRQQAAYLREAPRARIGDFEFVPLATPPAAPTQAGLPLGSFARDNRSIQQPTINNIPSSPLAFVGPVGVVGGTAYRREAAFYALGARSPVTTGATPLGQPGPAPLALLAAYARETRYVRQPFITYPQAAPVLLAPPNMVDPEFIGTPLGRQFTGSPVARHFNIAPPVRKFTGKE